MSGAEDSAKREASLFTAPGVMAERCRAFDWASTALGPVSGWSQSLRTIVSSMLASRHPMFLWWGPQLIQIYNDGYLPSFGASGRDVAALGALGREHWEEIWSVIGPEVESILVGGDSTWHEDHLVPITRNGRVEDVYWTYGYSPVPDDDGSVGGVLVVVQETTGRVQFAAEREGLIAAERQARADADAARDTLARVFAQAPVAIAVLFGRELRYVVANPKYAQIIGGRDPVGKTMVEMFPELKGTEIELVLEKVYDTGVAFAANDLLIRFDSRGTGEIDTYYDLVYHPLTSERGEVSGVVVVALDVTERRWAILERERLLGDAERARAEAEFANRAKSEFLAAMSHELRTPLNAIGGFVQLVEMGIHGPVTAAQREALGRTQRSQQHLLSLINDVLNFVKIEAGRVEYIIGDVPLVDAVADVAPMIEAQMAAKEIRYEERVTPGIIARADPEKLQQILINLLTNAAKFTERGGCVTVKVTERESGPSGDKTDFVFLDVVDTGCGIPQEKQDIVFDPFVQVHRNLTRTTEGTGLGLAISRDLARGMGGELRVQSVDGQGSTFTLELPRA